MSSATGTWSAIAALMVVPFAGTEMLSASTVKNPPGGARSSRARLSVQRGSPLWTLPVFLTRHR